ncbi:MAG: hypothetical protein C0513_08770 [Isosphaera sp.]|nr:hypothetical protein [Isosphaera sp.]
MILRTVHSAAILLAAAGAGCTAGGAGSTIQGEGSAAPLSQRLEDRKAQFLRDADPAVAQTYERGIEDVRASGVLQSAKRVGDTAPNFTLRSAKGDSVTLTTLLSKGPVVLTWYRGGWCPYCNIQLRALQEYLPQFEAAGASLVALSPETPDNSLSTQEKNALRFDVLSDLGLTVADRYGVRYRLPREVENSFKPGGLDLAKLNGDDSWNLPLSATYVIDRGGTIRYAFVNADYRLRAEPSEILAALRALQAD